jgi:hypothetical protein
MADDEIRDGVTVRDPVGDVVERLRVHDTAVPRKRPG